MIAIVGAVDPPPVPGWYQASGGTMSITGERAIGADAYEPAAQSAYRITAADRAGAREAYLARHPNAVHWVDYGDFAFWRLDVEEARLFTPPLTTVRQPMEAMGAMAANLVVEGINAVLEKREVSAVHRKMAPELAVRESTRNLL